MASATVNMHDAKTNLSRLVERIESGADSEIVLARNGRPVARIVPLAQKTTRRKLGLARGDFAALDFEAFQSLDADVEGQFQADTDRATGR